MKRIELSSAYLAEFLIKLIILFSSFDIILNFKVSGFSIRLIYVLTILLILLLATTISLSKVKLRFIGLFPFLLWLLVIFIFIPNAYLLRNVGYAFLLIIHFLIVLIFPIYFNNKKKVTAIFKFYILSFYYLSFIGFIQFILSLIGIDFYIEQYWPNTNFPRVNAFSYEPSYFATYLIIGWSILFYVISNNYEEKFFKKEKTWRVFLIITIAILLSSSRMGILFMVLQIVVFSLLFLFKSLITNKLSIKGALLISSIFCALILCITFFFINLERVRFMLSGTGIGGSASHSSAPRINKMIQLVDVFLDEPLKGYSLGGIPYAVAKNQGLSLSSQSQAKKFEGMNIFLEVLVASGTIGFTFFLIYIFFLFAKPFFLLRAGPSKDNFFSVILKSSLWSLFFVLALLNFNQNILRAYVWVHIAIINTTYFIIKREYFGK